MTLAVLLAAGPGTRLRPLTRDRPKSMLAVAGEPILHHLLQDLVTAGVTDAVLVVGHGHQRIRAYLGDGDRYGLRLTYVQQDRQLGPGHAALQARDAVAAAGANEALLLPADAWYHPDLLGRLLAADGPALVEVPDLRSGRHGTPVLSGGRVVELHEAPGPGDSRVSSGAYKVPVSLFDAIEAHGHSLRDAIRSELSAGPGWHRVTARAEEYVDVIEPGDLLHLQRILMDRVVTHDGGHREAGVIVQGAVHIGEGTTLHAGTVVQGPAHIGNGCSIGPHAVIGPGTSIRNHVRIAPFTFTADASIASNVVIGSHARIREAVLDNGVEVGSGARIAGDAVLVGSDARIGHDARIAPGARIGHDARVADDRHVGDVPDGGVAV